MDPIEIPVAILPIKLLMSFACLFIILVVLWWGVPKFRTYLRVATGREPRKPGTRTIHLALGFLVYLIIFAPAVIAALIFLEITTTPPSIVSAAGVSGGGGALSSRKTIAWDEVTRVNCSITRDHRVTSLRVIATSQKIELSGGGDLSSVRDYIWSRVPHGAIRPCAMPFRNR